MAFPQQRYALTLLVLIAVAWGIALLIPRVVPAPKATATSLPQQRAQLLALLPPDAPVAEILATIQVQTGLLLTREDALAYQRMVKYGLPPEQALQIVLLYRQALLKTS